MSSFPNHFVQKCARSKSLYIHRLEFLLLAIQMRSNAMKTPGMLETSKSQARFRINVTLKADSEALRFMFHLRVSFHKFHLSCLCLYVSIFWLWPATCYFVYLTCFELYACGLRVFLPKVSVDGTVATIVFSAKKEMAFKSHFSPFLGCTQPSTLE